MIDVDIGWSRETNTIQAVKPAKMATRIHFI